MKSIVNRAIITVKPKAPFIAWVQSADEDNAHITAETITESPNVYMVDDDEDGMNAEKLIKKNFKVIFEEELNGWIIDDSMWPTKRDLYTFNEWFQVTVYGQIFDLGEQEIQKEEW